MTSETPHSDQPLSPAALYRAAADAELSPAQKEAFERLRKADPAAQARLETEGALRASIARIMGQASTPAELGDRIRRALAVEASEDAGPISFQKRAVQAPRSWQRPWWMGVAAGLLLALGVMFVVAPWSGPTNPSTDLALQSPFSTTSLVGFLEEQHSSCADLGPVFRAKMAYRTRADAERAAIELLDVVPDIFDLPAGELLDQGYRFAGLGQCRIPGEGASAHLLYSSDDESQPPISLWIQRDTGEWRDRVKEIGTCYGLSLCEERGTSLSIWRKDGLVYFLYTANRELESPARAAFSAPTLADTI